MKLHVHQPGRDKSKATHQGLRPSCELMSWCVARRRHGLQCFCRGQQWVLQYACSSDCSGIYGDSTLHLDHACLPSQGPAINYRTMHCCQTYTQIQRYTSEAHRFVSSLQLLLQRRLALVLNLKLSPASWPLPVWSLPGSRRGAALSDAASPARAQLFLFIIACISRNTCWALRSRPAMEQPQ